MVKPVKNIRSRDWCFTYNNYTDEDVERITNLHYKYLIYGFEKGASKTPHLQGYIYFDNARNLQQVKRLLGNKVHASKRKAADLERAITYCKKDGDFREFGIKPANDQSKGQTEVERWTEIRQLGKAGDMERLEEFPKELTLYKEKLLAIREPKNEPIDGPLRHEWWIGPTGTGKSRLLWELYPQHYSKALNKWWDNYDFQDVVAIEEWSPKNECTASALKKWADRYPFGPEIKGATLPRIRPTKIIVLSNYTIEQCFPQKEDCDPLLRRFKIVQFPQSIPWAKQWAANYYESIKLPTLNELLLTDTEDEEELIEIDDDASLSLDIDSMIESHINISSL